jgi:CarD family transcriptional regulator
MQTQHQFKVGDKAVYPARGVAEIVAIEERDIGGNKMQFYILQILGNDPKSAAGADKIMVPVSNAKNVGLRSLLSEEDITDIFEILNEEPVAFDNQTWNRRYRGFMDKIKTGSPFDAAEVMRDLYRLRCEKKPVVRRAPHAGDRPQPDRQGDLGGPRAGRGKDHGGDRVDLRRSGLSTLAPGPGDDSSTSAYIRSAGSYILRPRDG